MVIVLLVSLAALLLAAAGLARHIWLRRARLNSNPGAGGASSNPGGAVFDPVEEIDPEIEI